MQTILIMMEREFTALARLISPFMSAVNAVKGATFIIVEPLLVATAIYFCLCFPTSKIIAYFERRMSRGDKR